MIKNSQRKKQKRKEEEERKRRAAKWLANFIDAVAVSAGRRAMRPTHRANRRRSENSVV
jgi:hypothetical protein